jgi:hypothetical protein
MEKNVYNASVLRAFIENKNHQQQKLKPIMPRPSFFYNLFERLHKTTAILLGLVIAIVIVIRIFRNFEGFPTSLLERF